MSFCYSDNGKAMRAVDQNYKQADNEIVLDHYATNEELALLFPEFTKASKDAEIAIKNAEIKERLAELDKSVIRTLQEAILAIADKGVEIPPTILERLNRIELDKHKLRETLHA